MTESATTPNAGAPLDAGSRHGVDEQSHGTQIFSAPSDAPRVRWRTDLISAGFTLALLVFVIIVAGEGSSFDDNVLAFTGDLPGWLLWLGQAAYVVGVVYAFGLFIGVGIFAKDRLELLRDLLSAAVLAVVAVLLLSQWLDDRWPELAFFDLQETRTTFPAFFVTTSAAIQAAASPHLSAPMRKIGWTFILAAVLASVFGGVTTVSDALGGLLVGLISAALIRYAFGTSAGLPSTNRIRAGLADLGVQVDALRYADNQPAGSIVLTGTAADGGAPLFVSGLGRDSWSTRRWTRIWRAAWYQDQGAQYGSDRRQQVEHESLVMLLADQAGVSVPRLVTVGMTGRDDALLVSDLHDHTLNDVADGDVNDDMLDAIWALLGKLHDAGLSHGSLDSIHIWFDSDGAPALNRSRGALATGRPLLGVDLRWSQWLDEVRAGSGYLQWHPVDLGKGQTGWVGGWDVRTRDNPPEDSLGHALQGIPRFVQEVTLALPRLEIEIVGSKRSGDLLQVSARVVNRGGLGTEFLDPGGLGAVSFELVAACDAAIVAGEAQVTFDRLGPGETSRPCEWLVCLPEGGALRLQASAPRTVEVQREVRP